MINEDIRHPIVDNQFYKANFEELEDQIKGCFLGKLGPGELPVKRDNHKKINGIIVPHAGYDFSGSAMAWAYKELAERKFPDVFLILGTNHTGIGARFGILKKDMKVPFSIVKTDKEFCDDLIKESHLIRESSMAHKDEHSIEVQLPFLQFVSKQYLPDLKIVPMLVSSYDFEEIREVANAVFKIANDKNICVIISGDFTHYGNNFGYAPFSTNVKDKLYELDGEAIEFIKKLDTEGFLNFVKEKKATICGAAPIALGMEICKKLGSQKGRLLRYYTSGDIVGDYSNTVGYAAIALD